MTNDWVFDLESKIYSKVKRNTQTEVLAKFPTAKYTTSNESFQEATFPTIYIHELEGVENGVTTEGTVINAYLCTHEVTVTCNTKREDVKWIIHRIINQYKAMGFQIIQMPIVLTSANTFYAVARCRRTVGSNEF